MCPVPAPAALANVPCHCTHCPCQSTGVALVIQPAALVSVPCQHILSLYLVSTSCPSILSMHQLFLSVHQLPLPVFFVSTSCHCILSMRQLLLSVHQMPLRASNALVSAPDFCQQGINGFVGAWTAVKARALYSKPDPCKLPKPPNGFAIQALLAVLLLPRLACNWLCE